MNMKKLLIGSLSLILAFASCENPSSGGGDGDGNTFNDNPVTSFAGTRWTDDLLPESTIEFSSATSLLLTGRYWEQIKGENNGVSGTHVYETAADLSADKVEPAVLVLMDTTKRTGFELHYYKADAATGKHQRLIVWYSGHLAQPREFYLH